jgi:hypothetical protein
MIRKIETFAMTGSIIAAYCSLVLGQATTPTLLEVDMENVVAYQGDTSDLSLFATNPNITPRVPPIPPRNFGEATMLGDIVAVNGQPAKGTFADRGSVISANPTPNPGQAIADATRSAIAYRTFEFMKTDGTPVGTIMVMGLNGGSSPPGPAFGSQNFAIVGGTGAFLGVRGQQGGRQLPQTIPVRQATMAEDPANRRVNGGGRVRWLLYVIPASAPEIVATPGGPAVTHSIDFSLVSASKPAAAGEILSAFVTGLGPTRPGVDAGQPFPPAHWR